MTKRQQYKVGAIVKVPFEGTRHTYARLLTSPVIAFYDAATDIGLPLDDILPRPILFRIAVMKHAITSGRWTVVGVKPLEPSLQEATIFFRQDATNPDHLFFHQEGHESPATREDCLKLERAAVWEPEHVEERLADYYAGRINQWVELLRLK